MTTRTPDRIKYRFTPAELVTLVTALGHYVSDRECVDEDSAIEAARCLRANLVADLEAEGHGRLLRPDPLTDTAEHWEDSDDGQPTSWDERRDFAGDDEPFHVGMDDGEW